MYGFHIFILPWVVAALIGIHLALVRIKGVVKPYADDEAVRR
jgi:quinol-cytochrome oxidoreductase complex cytochrome b subunit